MIERDLDLSHELASADSSGDEAEVSAAGPEETADNGAAPTETVSAEIDEQAPIAEPEAQIMGPEVRALVMDHIGLAYSVARRFQRKGVDPKDLQQVALVETIGAAERFDPERGIKFSSFAVPSIMGALKRYLRDKTWQARVPRGVKETALKIRGAQTDLEQELGRRPTITELSAAIQVSEPDIQEAMRALASRAGRSLNSPSSREEMNPSIAIDEQRNIEDILTAQALISLLNPEERKIIHMRFWEGLSQAQIGKELGISQVHAGRRLQEIFQKLERLSQD